MRVADPVSATNLGLLYWRLHLRLVHYAYQIVHSLPVLDGIPIETDALLDCGRWRCGDCLGHRLRSRRHLQLSAHPQILGSKCAGYMHRPKCLLLWIADSHHHHRLCHIVPADETRLGPATPYETEGVNDSYLLPGPGHLRVRHCAAGGFGTDAGFARHHMDIGADQHMDRHRTQRWDSGGMLGGV